MRDFRGKKSYIEDAIEESYAELNEQGEDYPDSYIDDIMNLAFDEGDIPPEISTSKFMLPLLSEINSFKPENVSLGWAHRVGEKIYIETASHKIWRNGNSSKEIDAVIQAIKEKYPNCTVYEAEESQGSHKKIAKRLIKAIDFTKGNGDRVRDLAIMYINGDI